MSDLPPIGDDQEPELVKIDLGDIGGHDEELKSKNKRLADLINKDVSKPITTRIIELLVLIKSPGLFVTYKILESTFNWIKKRLTDHILNEVNLKQREADAELIRSEANINRASASAIRKETELKESLQQVQVQAIHTYTQLKLISFLEDRGIAWQAEYDDDGQMNIVVTKHSRIGPDSDT